MSEDKTLREELEQTHTELGSQLASIDGDMLSKIAPGVEIDVNTLKNWYLLHVLSMTIDAALTQQQLTLPSDIMVWQKCFGTSNKVLQAIWKQLLQLDHPNDDVIMPVLHDLQTSLETQLVPLAIRKQLQTWTVMPNPMIGMDLLRDEQSHGVDHESLKSALKKDQDQEALDMLDSNGDFKFSDLDDDEFDDIDRSKSNKDNKK